MKKCVLALIFLLPFVASAAYAEPVLCVRSAVKPTKSGSVRLGPNIKSVEGTCPRGFVQAFANPSSNQILSSLLTVDGATSGLDAAKLNGQSASFYAPQSSLDSTNSAVQTLEGETRIGRVIRVASSGGDFSSLSDAIASIASPSVSNPYLVTVAPGTYSLSARLSTPAGAQVQGAGATQTILQGAVSAVGYADSALISLQSGSHISDLGVENTATSGLRVTGVEVSEGTATNVNDVGSFPTTIQRVKVEISSASPDTVTGVAVDSADVRIVDTSISISGGAVTGQGIFAMASSGAHTILLESSSIFTQGPGAFRRGIYCAGDVGVDMTVSVASSRIYGSGVAIYSTYGGKVKISSSSLTSDNLGIDSRFSAVVAATSVVIDAPTHTDTSISGTITCSYVSDETGAPVSGCG